MNDRRRPKAPSETPAKKSAAIVQRTPDNLVDIDDARRDDDVAVLRRELHVIRPNRPYDVSRLLAAIVAEADA